MRTVTTGEGAVPENWRKMTVLPIPIAGRIVGLRSRASAYRAASRGDLPTLPLGSRRVVPVAKLRRMLGELPDAGAEGLMPDTQQVGDRPR